MQAAAPTPTPVPGESNRNQHVIDVLSGLTVALALVPEAVAFAFVAGIPPIFGLYAAFMVGLITAVIGGRPGMISGATGALAVVMTGLVTKGNELGVAAGYDGEYGRGLQYLFATVILMGWIQITAGICRLGKFVRLIPFPVMLGFVNGLAIVIGKAQFGQFEQLTTPGDTATAEWIGGNKLWITIGFIALTMAIIHFWPKINKKVPGALLAIIVVTAIVHFSGLEIDTVKTYLVNRTGNEAASVEGSFPPFNGIPDIPYTWETFIFILPFAIILASIGLIESLMTLSLIDDMTNTRGRGNKECVGQGVANVVTGAFSGMGGCAMIGQSMINISSGGRGRLSGIVAALGLLAFILFGASWIEMVPLAALVGVMFIVVIATFEWTTLKILHKVPLSDAFTVVLVTVVTVYTDLAIAVGVGILWSAVVFAWKAARHMNAVEKINDEGSKIYILHGPLFFGSTLSFKEIFNIEEDPEDVIIDFRFTRVWDHSGVEAIGALAERYQAAGKKLHIRHLSKECAKLLDKASTMIEVNRLEDPDYHIADDRLG